MKKLFSLLTVAALATGVGSAWAEGEGKAQQKTQEKTQQGQTQKQQAAQTAHRHVLQGRITGIDKNEGSVKVQTARGEIELNLPPASLQGLNQGDEVNLEVAIRPATTQVQPKQQQQPQKQPEKQPEQHQQ